MTNQEVEPIIDKLREAERIVLSIINDDRHRAYWSPTQSFNILTAAQSCKILIWKAMEAAGDMAISRERENA